MKRKIVRTHPGKNGFQYIMDAETRKELNPFVFFDAGVLQQQGEGLSFGYHPHSGVGIFTYFEGADLQHGDTSNPDYNNELIRDGGVQFINTGGGIFHTEGYKQKEEETRSEWPLTIHQLWLLLPPELEESDADYANYQPEELPVVGGVKIISGSYGGKTSPLKSPYNMTYLDITLKSGEAFKIDTPKGQTRGFIFPRQGSATMNNQDIKSDNLNILDNNEGSIEITAVEDFKAVLIMTEPYEHPIVSYGGSIHTNKDSLKRSATRIGQIRNNMSIHHPINPGMMN